MIHDLDFAMRMHDHCREVEFVVSERVLRQILAFPGRGTVWVQLNIPQEGLRYRFLSRITWRGMLFVHPSRDPVCFRAASIGLPA